MCQDGKKEEEEFNTGPLSVLMMSVKNNTQVSHLNHGVLHAFDLNVALVHH